MDRRVHHTLPLGDHTSNLPRSFRAIPRYPRQAFACIPWDSELQRDVSFSRVSQKPVPGKIVSFDSIAQNAWRNELNLDFVLPLDESSALDNIPIHPPVNQRQRLREGVGDAPLGLDSLGRIRSARLDIEDVRLDSEGDAEERSAKNDAGEDSRRFGAAPLGPCGEIRHAFVQRSLVVENFVVEIVQLAIQRLLSDSIWETVR